MSASRQLRRRLLREAGWRGATPKRRRRGKDLPDAIHDVAVVLGVLKMRDRVKAAEPHKEKS